MELSPVNIEANLRTYLGDRNPTARYTSFDYCFNHFQTLHDSGFAEIESPAVMELTSLHLGFYLASWGMLRGSAPLLQHSVKFFEPVVEVIATVEPKVWGVDAHSYAEGGIEAIMDTAASLRRALPPGSSNTLVTKIMLGVFGCVPAFDTYFKNGLGVSTFGPKPLRKVTSFYEANAESIERHRVATLDYSTGANTNYRYTRAKVIDMIFFIEGGPEAALMSKRELALEDES